jgi:hypothetical protein
VKQKDALASKRVEAVGQLAQLEADKGKKRGKAKDKTPHKAKKRTDDKAEVEERSGGGAF